MKQLFLVVSLFLTSQTAALADDPAPVVRGCIEPDGHHLVLDEKTCPVGGEKFKAIVPVIYSTYGSYLDLTPVSYLQFPLPVPVCPSNGIAAYKSEFTAEELAVLTRIAESEEFRALLTGKNTSWYLFAKQADMGSFADVDLWWLYSRAAAEAETCGYTDILPSYQTEASRAVGDAMNGMEASHQYYWPLMLLAINYDRKQGRFGRAEKRLAALEGIPEDWQPAFATLAEAVKRRTTGRVRIGEYEEKPEGVEQTGNLPAVTSLWEAFRLRHGD